MSETSFSINDLLRRKLQTVLIVLSLALSVASTLFLLLSAQKIGFGISLMVEGRLTSGFSAVFSPFMLLLTALILISGAVMVSFMVSMMMSQRIRDIGLIKAAGCPNHLVFGYFFTELLLITLIGCVLGVFLGSAADFASTSFFQGLGQVSRFSFNPWIAVLVFALFSAIALVVGFKPIYDTTRLEPAKAMSPAHYLGLAKESGFRALSSSGIASKIAIRSLIRHRSTTIRIVLCLSVVFTLVTVGVAGGLIADQTTKSWVEKALGRNTVLIAHHDVCEQYTLLLKEFSAGSSDLQFNYTNGEYIVPDSLVNQLRSLRSGAEIDRRLVLETSAEEVQGIIYGDSTTQTKTVGDSRREKSLIVGVEPEGVSSKWFLEGRFLGTGQVWEAVVGDTLAGTMFSEPLAQRIKVFGKNFDVVGICIDPVNNGKVAYVPLQILQNITSIAGPNMVLLQTGELSNRTEFLNQVQTVVKAQNLEFSVLELNGLLDENVAFLGYIWSSVMLLPLFSLIAASLCLVGYVILAIDEQRQELGVLRAVGARPRTVVSIVSGQSVLVLLSSYGVGVAVGTIITLLILTREPIVTSYSVLNIAGLLTIALIATFIAALYPAVRFSKKPLLEVMRQG